MISHQCRNVGTYIGNKLSHTTRQDIDTIP